MIFKNILINKNKLNQRLDNFIFSLFKYTIKKNIYKSIRNKFFLVNKKSVKHNYKLKLNDIVNIPQFFHLKIQKIFNNKQLTCKIINNRLYEDKNLLIINKPSGIPVHSGTKTKLNIINLLQTSLNYKNSYLKLAHRLDKNTSGCLLIAKNKNFLLELQKLIKKNKINKEYHVIIKGNINKQLDIILSQRIMHNYNKKIKNNNKITHTYCNPIINYKLYTLIKAYPTTGKIHQIRIHLTHIGHPIIGDKKYGSITTNNKQKNIQHLFLHSKSIKFTYPKSNTTFNIQAPYTWKTHLFL